jgi:phosphoribosylformimino-5-aminoimidazole carboxamide ribotide isomerase
MDLILAMDLKEGSVVHGSRGERATYRPLTWGISPVAEPVAYTKNIGPRFLYIADIDRILGIGNHDEIIRTCATLVDHCYVDRGCRNPGDYLAGDGIVNIVGTETGGVDLSIYEGGFISLDIKGGLVIPSGKDPETMLREANRLPFEGCIILDIGAVGTEGGINRETMEQFRSAYEKTLFLGGGVRGQDDLFTLKDAGFDGAIVATALHRGNIPRSWIREGYVC